MSEDPARERPPRVDPAGRPSERLGFQAFFALALIFTWIVVVAFILWVTSFGAGLIGTGPSPWLFLLGIATWFAAEDVAGRRNLVWPGSALGIVGPLSIGFAAALATPELRHASAETHIAIVSGISASLMLCFLFKFRLPGLVSPVMTFAIVALFLTLHGADPERLGHVEGFSPRGLVAALLDQPIFVAAFASLGLWAAILARRLDINGDDFGLAAARPLHLIGCGITALIAGRLVALLPQPLDCLLLFAGYGLAFLYALRINRVAVLVAIHFAIVKPTIKSVTVPFGIHFDLYEWSLIITMLLFLDFLLWPFLHRLSQEWDWTLGPGGRKPPTDRKGWLWRYWPYA